MNSLSGEFQTDLGKEDTLVACAEAIDGLGWQIESVDADRITAYAGSDRAAPTIEVILDQSQGNTKIGIIGTDSAARPVGEAVLITALNEVRDAIHASIEHASPEAPTAPAGWYADPLGGQDQRYWDGTQWTDRVQSFQSGQPRATPDRPEPPGFFDRFREAPLWIKIIVPVVILLVIVGAVSDGDDSSDLPTTTSSQAVHAAKREARRAAAANRRAAIRRQRQALVIKRRRAAAKRAQIQAQRARARAARQAALAEQAQQKTAPPPVASSTSDCDPNYSGCLDPNALDYDCEGGSGDGPEYTGSVQVLGDDHYDLDSNGNGTGCEP
jgi:hypothetical protein